MVDRLPGLYLWPHGFVDEATLASLKAGCAQRGIGMCNVPTQDVPSNLVTSGELEGIRLAAHADVAAEGTGEVNRQRRHKFKRSVYGQAAALPESFTGDGAGNAGNDAGSTWYRKCMQCEASAR